MEKITPRIFARAEHIVSRKNIDSDALKVLYRLRNHGYLAYLVGGGVRDLLLQRPVKDFDVVTDAHPSQLRKLFRNCRVVGRRFRLAHIIFHDKILEVSTFRKTSDFEAEEAEETEETEGSERPSDLLIREDNTFGTPEDDAYRRDLTINGLFYDIATFRIIDYVGGMGDLQNRLIRTIGDPNIRFQEDPVRMLRALRFAARLDFTLDGEVEEALLCHRERIRLGARSRLLEELVKMLQQGASEQSFRLMQKVGMLKILLPSISTFIDETGDDGLLWQALRSLDGWIAKGRKPPRDILWSVLWYVPFQELRVEGNPEETLKQFNEFLTREQAFANIPRRERAGATLMLSAVEKLCPGDAKYLPSIMRKSYFNGAMELLEIVSQAFPEAGRHLDCWRSLLAAAKESAHHGAPKLEEKGRRRRRPRPRRRKPQAPDNQGSSEQSA